MSNGDDALPARSGGVRIWVLEYAGATDRAGVKGIHFPLNGKPFGALAIVIGVSLLDAKRKPAGYFVDSVANRPALFMNIPSFVVGRREAGSQSGLFTISQNTAATLANAGTPSQNHMRASIQYR
jgi:hypothetical protein